MNRKTVVDKRYKPLTDTHSQWVKVDEYRIGPRRTLTPGQVVKITGVRAALFEFMYAEKHAETDAVTLTFVGGRNGHRMVRAFTPDRVGAFVRKANYA